MRTRGLDPRGDFLLRLPCASAPVTTSSATRGTGRWSIHTCALDLPQRVAHTLWRVELAVHPAWRTAGPLRRTELLREAMLAWSD